MRKHLIMGNWKMNGLQQPVTHLVQAIKQGWNFSIDCALLPSFVHLALVKELLGDTAIALGAQDLYPGSQGAFTGEVSGPMLKDAGCRYVLVGHSERRRLFNENLEVVVAKFHAALQAGLIPVLCVGETQAEREANETEAMIRAQLASVFSTPDTIKSECVIAYEPVWAIGTGLTATPVQAESVHAFIRSFFAQINIDMANTIRILYGGSMNAENAEALLGMPNIDGGLIGGASLDAASFLKICAAAA